MMKRYMTNKMALAGAVCIGVILVAAVFAPFIATHDPAAIDPKAVLEAPSPAHLFGTDTLGRDIFSRIVYGSRISLIIGFVAVGIAVLIGVALGSLAGYYGGIVDALIMRFVDIMLCFPTFFLILAVIAVLEPSLFTIMAVIGMTSWMGVARLIRAEILTLKEREYVAAARIMGGSDLWIITRHLVPNAIAPVLVSASRRAVRVGRAALPAQAHLDAAAAYLEAVAAVHSRELPSVIAAASAAASAASFAALHAPAAATPTAMEMRIP